MLDDVERLDARSVLELAIRTLGRDRVALASSFGAEDIVIADLLCEIEARPRIFTLDTGRLPAETYALMDATQRRYGVDVEVYVPDAIEVEAMVAQRGLNLMYESVEDRKRCCGVRKVQPLERALATVDGWITGLRRDQLATRAATPKIGPDEEHGGLWKVAPLADWTHQQVWDYIRSNRVPYNELHDQGYPSIGCAPCTRAIRPGENVRAGRWWWEEPAQRECGIHFDPQAGRFVPNRPIPSPGQQAI